MRPGDSDSVVDGSRGRALRRRFPWHLDSSGFKIFDDSGSFFLHDPHRPGKHRKNLFATRARAREPILHLSLGVFLF